MKKYFSAALILILCLAMVFTVSGCKKEEAEPEDVSPSASASPSEEPSSTPDASPSVSVDILPSSEPSENVSGRDDESELSFTVEGDQQTEAATLVSADFVTGIRGYGYSLYRIEDGYQYSKTDSADLISSTLIPNCFIELRYIEGHTVESAIPAFLDDYLSYTDIEYTGDFYLGGTLLTQGATATDGKLTYTAYLADADGGILSFVLCCPNDALEGQMARLYAMLDSFQFNY